MAQEMSFRFISNKSYKNVVDYPGVHVVTIQCSANNQHNIMLKVSDLSIVRSDDKPGWAQWTELQDRKMLQGGKLIEVKGYPQEHIGYLGYGSCCHVGYIVEVRSERKERKE